MTWLIQDMAATVRRYAPHVDAEAFAREAAQRVREMPRAAFVDWACARLERKA